MRFMVSMIVALTLLSFNKVAVAATARIVPHALAMSVMYKNNVMTRTNPIVYKGLRKIGHQHVNFAGAIATNKNNSLGLLGLWLMFLRSIGL